MAFRIPYPQPAQTNGLRLPAFAVAATGRVFSWRRRVATLSVAALALMMGYGVVFGHNGLTAFAHKRQEARTLEQQRLQLQHENDLLRGHVDRLHTDPGAIEHEAREALHYMRPGEVIYSLPASASLPGSPAQSSPVQTSLPLSQQ